MINALNKIRIKVPEVNIPLVGRVGGFEIGLPRIPTIPMLAAGGIIRSGGLALVGEAGPELLNLPRGAQVTPLPAGGTTINITGNTFRSRSDIDYLVSELKRLKI